MKQRAHWRSYQRGQQRGQQRGAAILIAMLVVTLVATLAAGLQWRQWRLLQTEAAARAQSQAAWVLVGALDWARLILREDARSAGNAGFVDHLGEPWAVPLQEAKLSSFLTADSLQDASQDTAYLSGDITDAQSKINLTNLVVPQAAPSPGQALPTSHTYRSLVRLYQQLHLPPNELAQWARRWQLSSTPSDAASSAAAQADAGIPLRPTRIEQLTWLGVPEERVALLKNYLTILPKVTPINLNTASPEVLAAAASDTDMAAVQKFVRSRAQTPLQRLSDASNILGLEANLLDTHFSISSQYFEVRGRLRLGDWVVLEESLLSREGLNVTTVWRRRM